MEMLEKEIYVEFGSRYRGSMGRLEKAFEIAGIPLDVREAVMHGHDEFNLAVLAQKFGDAGLPPEMLDSRGSCLKVLQLATQQESKGIEEHLRDCYRGCNSFVLMFLRDQDTSKEFRAVQASIRSALERYIGEESDEHLPDYGITAKGYRRLAELGFSEENVPYETLARLCDTLMGTEGQGKELNSIPL